MEVLLLSTVLSSELANDDVAIKVGDNNVDIKVLLIPSIFINTRSLVLAIFFETIFYVL